MIGGARTWGPVGAVLSALCCLGAAPVVWALSAVGLSFLVNDLILLPLLALFLGITLRALAQDRARHGAAGPLALAGAGSLAAFGGLWVSGVVAGAGLAAVVAGAVWSALRLRAAARG
ncbi:MAG: hypothetical protein RQ751_14130 [Longimicrobiales bacterium]|nr:hypothetical protein [Longimicrobiales bacterium]